LSGDTFELFWSAYPRRVAKKDARTALEKALKRTTLDAILTALEWQREQPTWQERDSAGVLSRVPHAASWLNGDRWDDEKPARMGSTAAIIPFMVPSCSECIDGWRENEMRQAVRCACRQVKARTA
jgi:hypothetical protein